MNACLLWVAATSTALALSGTATQATSIEAELGGPIRIQLTNGHQAEGRIARVTETELIIDTLLGNNAKVTQAFRYPQIHKLTFPGDAYFTKAHQSYSEKNYTKCRQLLDPLFDQRARLIQYCTPAEVHSFVILAQLQLEDDNPTRALAILEILRPHIASDRALRAVEDAVLESSFELQFHNESRAQAERWIADRSPYTRDALGYAVMASLALREGDLDQALDYALQPILFSKSEARETLRLCYAIAITAAHSGHDDAYAACLYQEMHARGIQWPGDNPLSDDLIEPTELTDETTARD